MCLIIIEKYLLFYYYAVVGTKINRERRINGETNATSRDGCLNGRFRGNERWFLIEISIRNTMYGFYSVIQWWNWDYG